MDKLPIIGLPTKPVRNAGGPSRIGYEILKYFALNGSSIWYLNYVTGDVRLVKSVGDLEAISIGRYDSNKAVSLIKRVMPANVKGFISDAYFSFFANKKVDRVLKSIEESPALHINGVNRILSYLNLSEINKPFIWTEQSKGSLLRELHMLFGYRPQGRAFRSIYKAYEKLLAESNIITFPSWSAVDLFEDYTGWQIPRDRLRIVYNGIPDPHRIYPGLVPDKNYEPNLVVTVAEHVPEKGLDLALEALVRSDRPWRWVVIGGETSWTSKLKALIAKVTTSASAKIKVELAGSKKHKDALQLLSRAHVVLFTQRVAVFDLALLEAMSLSKIIIATKVGGNIEALGADYPYLATEVDELAHILQMQFDLPSIGNALGIQNRRRFKELFTVERMVGGYSRCYEEI